VGVRVSEGGGGRDSPVSLIAAILVHRSTILGVGGGVLDVYRGVAPFPHRTADRAPSKAAGSRVTPPKYVYHPSCHLGGVTREPGGFSIAARVFDCRLGAHFSNTVGTQSDGPQTRDDHSR
jgi:hypothetical protein